MSTGYDFSAQELRKLAASQKGGPLAGAWREHGDHVLNPGILHFLESLKLRDAAVLIPVVDDGPETRVILTQRTAHLRKHSGQVAFPGGSIDAGDGSAEVAALREAQEEIGLDPAFVETLCRLPDYLTMTGFRITPVLALVTPGFVLSANPDEVDHIFDVPLSFLMDPAHHRIDSRVWQEADRFFYTMPYENHPIWGVTAGIIRTLYERLYA